MILDRILSRLVTFKHKTLWASVIIHNCRHWTISRPEICNLITPSISCNSEGHLLKVNCPQTPPNFRGRFNQRKPECNICQMGKKESSEDLHIRSMVNLGVGLELQQTLILEITVLTNLWTTMSLINLSIQLETVKREEGLTWIKEDRKLSNSKSSKLRNWRHRNRDRVNLSWRWKENLFWRESSQLRTKLWVLQSYRYPSTRRRRHQTIESRAPDDPKSKYSFQRPIAKNSRHKEVGRIRTRRDREDRCLTKRNLQTTNGSICNVAPPTIQ